jgi:NADH dehydrogenase
MKKVTEMLLITGGSGFIGKYLSAHIVLNTDEKIRIFSSDPNKFFFALEEILLSSLDHIKTQGSSGFYSQKQVDLAKTRYANRESIIARNIEIHKGDITSGHDVAQALDEVDKVIHAAGILNARKSHTVERVNYSGTKNLVEMMAKNHIGPLINIGILGTSPNSTFSFHHSKWRAEQEIIKSGIEFKLFKTSLVLGKEDNFTNRMKRAIDFPIPILPVPEKKDTFFQPILVHDLATAVLSCLKGESSKHSVYKIGGPEYFSLTQIVDIYLDLMGKHRLVLPISPKFLTTPAKVLERIMSEPFVTSTELQGLSQNNIGELDSIYQYFGFTPLSIKNNLIL